MAAFQSRYSKDESLLFMVVKLVGVSGVSGTIDQNIHIVRSVACVIHTGRSEMLNQI